MANVWPSAAAETQRRATAPDASKRLDGTVEETALVKPRAATEGLTNRLVVPVSGQPLLSTVVEARDRRGRPCARPRNDAQRRQAYRGYGAAASSCFQPWTSPSRRVPSKESIALPSRV